jgi:hypothetical protein
VPTIGVQFPVDFDEVLDVDAAMQPAVIVANATTLVARTAAFIFGRDMRERSVVVAGRMTAQGSNLCPRHPVSVFRRMSISPRSDARVTNFSEWLAYPPGSPATGGRSSHT